MGTRVVQDPTVLDMITDPDGTPATVDISDYVRAVRISTTADEVDTGSFKQARTKLGQPRHSIVFAVLWSPEMRAALLPQVNQEVEFHLQEQEDVDATKRIEWRGSFAFVPWGSWELNSRVESDLPIAVITEPDYVDAV